MRQQSVVGLADFGIVQLQRLVVVDSHLEPLFQLDVLFVLDDFLRAFAHGLVEDGLQALGLLDEAVQLNLGREMPAALPRAL